MARNRPGPSHSGTHVLAVGRTEGCRCTEEAAAQPGVLREGFLEEEAPELFSAYEHNSSNSRRS